jgi:hypothetical protein
MQKTNHYYQIKKLLNGKTINDKIEFCNQCIEEPEKYTEERIFALKEYRNNLLNIKNINLKGD